MTVSLLMRAVLCPCPQMPADTQGGPSGRRWAFLTQGRVTGTSFRAPGVLVSYNCHLSVMKSKSEEDPVQRREVALYLP